MEQRVIIIGNSGSGKSYLAGVLGSSFQRQVIHLDRLFWAPGGFNEKRATELVHTEIEEMKRADSWIVEGVFGELALRFCDRAEFLMWLDLEWDVCRTSLLARGSESAKQLESDKAEESFRELIAWAGDYWERTDLRSYAGHLRIFEKFSGQKLRFSQRCEVDAYLALKKHGSGL